MIIANTILVGLIVGDKEKERFFNATERKILRFFVGRLVGKSAEKKMSGGGMQDGRVDADRSWKLVHGGAPSLDNCDGQN